MSDNDTNVSGAPTVDSGAVDGQTETKADKSEDKKVVAWEDHKRALDDMHKFKREREELKARMGSIESERLREKEDFKGLAERYENEAKEYKEKYEGLNTSLQQNAKFNEVRAAALKAGLRGEAESDLELLGLDTVEVELTSNVENQVKPVQVAIESSIADAMGVDEGFAGVQHLGVGVEALECGLESIRLCLESRFVEHVQR